MPPAAAPQPSAQIRTGLTRLSLSDFRSYSSVHLSCTPSSVILAGPNGAGKTNVLEAISFLSPGRGLRQAKLSEVLRFEALRPVWAVSMRLQTPEGEVRLGTGIDPDKALERRITRIEGELIRHQSELTEFLNLIWMTPQMDRLFLEGASPRRRFFDRLVFGVDPLHAHRLSRYEQALRERNRLLKDGCRDGRWYDSLEEILAQEGVAVTLSRRDFCTQLTQALNEGAGVFPKARLVLEGEIEEWVGSAPAVAVEDRFRAVLKEQRGAAFAGSPEQGPHRSDWAVTFSKTDRPAAMCSTGEQKALLISIILASARIQALQTTGVPILLLDEVVAHLDEARRAALFEEITALGIQAWMTGTDMALFKDFSAAQVFRVAEGEILKSKTID